MLHALGLRFRLHRKDLPETPDVVLPKHRTAIFVNGCFSHRHRECRKATTPKTRVDFWARKFADNIARDQRNERALKQAGWTVLTIWQCETEKPDQLRRVLKNCFRK
jgi:DNA mismatch endonuclease (patch repair protein)